MKNDDACMSFEYLLLLWFCYFSRVQSMIILMMIELFECLLVRIVQALSFYVKSMIFEGKCVNMLL